MSLADWPFQYEHLEPYLTKIEWEFGISGIAGAEKGEGFRSKPYPSPPLRPTKWGRKFYDACNKMGINAFPIPHASVTNNHKGREPSNRTSFWNQYGDPSGARSNTLTTFIPEALATGNLELRADCFVREVTVGKDGKATGVIYIDDEGAEWEQEARVVVLALGAIETARLMLLSKSTQHPDGLANSSGLVGKNATFHEYLFAIGFFDQEIDDPLYGWTGNYISGGSMDFYETDENRGHIGGCITSASQICHPINYVFPGRPQWGHAFKDADRNFFNYAMKIGLILHDMPQEANRVDLDPTLKDYLGLPVARITHKAHDNDLAMGKWQVDKNIEILEVAGSSQDDPCLPGRGDRQHLSPARNRADGVRPQHIGAQRVVTVARRREPVRRRRLRLPDLARGQPHAGDDGQRLAKLRVHRRALPHRSRGTIAFARNTTSRNREEPDMSSKADWETFLGPVDPDSTEPLFFTRHEWDTVEAISARIIPTDHEPGAREARVVVFIDRYLSGIDYIYASADGSGFLRIDGRYANAWRARIADMQATYRAGLAQLDEIAERQFGGPFVSLDEATAGRGPGVAVGSVPSPGRSRWERRSRPAPSPSSRTTTGSASSTPSVFTSSRGSTRTPCTAATRTGWPGASSASRGLSR